MKRKIWIPFVLMILVLSIILPATLTKGQASLQCLPGGGNTVASQVVNIGVGGNQFLRGKFYWPVPPGPHPLYTNLPGIAMTHGIGGTYTDVEDTAAALSEECFVVLIWNYRGQGQSPEVIDTEYTFIGNEDRLDLEFVTDVLKDGPPETTNMVDENHLGIMGVSQGGTAAWLAVADNDLRGRYRAAIPIDAAPLLSDILLPHDCINASFASQFAPNLAITWEANTYS